MVTSVQVRRKYKNVSRITYESSGRWPHCGTGDIIISGTIIPCCRKTPAFVRGDAILRPSADVCVFIFSASVLIPLDYVLLLCALSYYCTTHTRTLHEAYLHLAFVVAPTRI